MEYNPLRRYRWHSPHPGLLGCPLPIPEPVRQAAVSLSGTITTPAEAVGKITASTRSLHASTYSVLMRASCIVVAETCPDSKGRISVWRALCGTPVE